MALFFLVFSYGTYRGPWRVVEGAQYVFITPVGWREPIEFRVDATGSTVLISSDPDKRRIVVKLATPSAVAMVVEAPAPDSDFLDFPPQKVIQSENGKETNFDSNKLEAVFQRSVVRLAYPVFNWLGWPDSHAKWELGESYLGFLTLVIRRKGEVNFIAKLRQIVVNVPFLPEPVSMLNWLPNGSHLMFNANRSGDERVFFIGPFLNDSSGHILHSTERTGL